MQVQTRPAALARLSRETFDLLVIGGGIGGACAAWDAALRGLNVALIEKSDFGSGASAHSLKVLHGGIRYLQHLDFTRLQESCRERAAFLRIAPHLTRPMPFALPTQGWGLQGKMPLRAAFLMLDVLTAGRNRDIPVKSQHVPSPYLMSRSEFRRLFPTFDRPGVTGAGVFFDGQMVNPPRLVYSIARSAQELGGCIANYCSAESLLERDGRAEGVVALDRLTGERFDIRARLVANLAGPFAPSLYRERPKEALRVPLSRDMALVLNRKLLPGIALGLQTIYKDPDAVFSRGNRHIFMTPWRDYTLVGVHSRVYEGDPSALTVTAAEIEGFFREVQQSCPGVDLSLSDVGVVNAGLLPIDEGDQGPGGLSLGKRSPLVDHVTRGGLDGLVTAMTVRWTMGRLTAERAIDLVMKKLGRDGSICRTAQTPVWGGDFEDPKKLQDDAARTAGAALPAGVLESLTQTFGTQTRDVLAARDLEVLPDGRTLAASVRHVVRNELAQTLNDVLLRRLDVGTGHAPDEAMLARCAQIVGEELGWSAERRAAETAAMRASYPFASPGSQARMPEAPGRLQPA